MDNTSAGTMDRLRLLESWLPLAQAENEHNCWGYDGPALERLILLSEASLRGAPTLLAARAAFWFHQQRVEQERSDSGEPGAKG